MRLFRSVSAVVAVAVLAGCDLSTAPNVPDPIDPAQDTYATALGINIASMTKTSTGLYYKDKVVGTGTASAKGDSVKVHYTLWLTNGTKVESSKDVNKPFEFQVGATPPHVIPGFDEGVLGMQPGGVRQLVVPPQLAYREFGNGPVQPNANIVFEIEYIDRVSGAK